MLAGMYPQYLVYACYVQIVLSTSRNCGNARINLLLLAIKCEYSKFLWAYVVESWVGL